MDYTYLIVFAIFLALGYWAVAHFTATGRVY